MKYLFYCLLLASGFAAGWYIYKPDGKQIDQLITEKERLIEQHRILLIGNTKLKKTVDENISIINSQNITKDSLLKLLQNDRKKNGAKITNLSTATDSTKLDIWAGKAGEK